MASMINGFTAEKIDKNDVLTMLIRFSLVQLSTLKVEPVQKDFCLQPIIFSKTLNFLVLLTTVKPLVCRENKTLMIKMYFELGLGTLVDLKDYLKQQIQLKDTLEKGGSTIDFSNQRLVVKSLMIIMCEFDTLSESNEVLSDIWEVIDSNFM